MIAYFSLIGLILLLYFYHGRNIVNHNNYLFNPALHSKTRNDVILISIVIFILIAFRSLEVGTDTDNYYAIYNTRNFEAIINGGILNSIEYGFTLTEYIGNKLNLGFGFIVFLEGLVYTIPLAYVIHKYSKNPYMSFILFICFDYFLFSMSGIRQTFAIGFCLISFEFIQKNKPFWFVVFVLIASSFHITSLCFLPAYFLKSFKINKVNIILIAFIGIMFFIFREPIFSFVRQFARMDYGDRETGGLGMYLFYCFLALVGIYTFFMSKYRNVPPLLDKRLYMFLLIVLIIYPTLQVNPTYFRLHYYYSIFFVLLIPNLLKRLDSLILRVTYKTIVYGISLYYLFSYSFVMFGAVPYTFGWLW